jgi:hypothetical protein
MGAVEFNPTAKPGDPTTACSTPAAAITVQQRRRTELEHRQPDAAPRLDHDRHPALRSAQSESHGGAKGLGDYTIPMANKFAADGDPKTLGEIYAYGFRNAHRSRGTPTARCSPPTSA